MPREVDHQVVRIDQFFAGPGARADQWCHLMELAAAWDNGTGEQPAFEAALAEMMATEQCHAYPGIKLLAVLREHGAAHNPSPALALCRRVVRALLTRSFRQNAGDWDAHDTEDAASPDSLHQAFSASGSHRPYFEVLIVTSAPASRWASLAEEWRRLRRPLDAFIYEPVFVGSFEDAFCAALLNTDLAAVVIHEGFPFRSRHDAPVLRTLAEAADQRETPDVSALHLVIGPPRVVRLEC
jgi:arginine decarboxylase